MEMVTDIGTQAQQGFRKSFDLAKIIFIMQHRIGQLL